MLRSPYSFYSLHFSICEILSKWSYDKLTLNWLPPFNLSAYFLHISTTLCQLPTQTQHLSFIISSLTSTQYTYYSNSCLFDLLELKTEEVNNINTVIFYNSDVFWLVTQFGLTVIWCDNKYVYTGIIKRLNSAQI